MWGSMCIDSAEIMMGHNTMCPVIIIWGTVLMKESILHKKLQLHTSSVYIW